jgi:hypothetical protein
MLGLATTILVSLGRERVAMALTALALGVLGTACVLTIPNAEFGDAQLRACALAVTCALAGALVLGVVQVRRAAHAFVPWKTALRVGACVAGSLLIGNAMPVFSKALTPLVATGIVLAYFGALIVTREIGRADLALVLSIVRRRTKG